MTQEESTMFIYNTISFANKAHYDTTGYMRYLENQNLNNATFHEMIVKNKDITDKLKIGGSFTFSCWVYSLLAKLKAIDFYILETTKKEDGSPNFVVLFRIENEYRICDLAKQVAESEKTRERLSSMALHPKEYSKKEKELVFRNLANASYINQDILEYAKEYDINIVLSMGIDETRPYATLKRMTFMDFLRKRQDIIQNNGAYSIKK